MAISQTFLNSITNRKTNNSSSIFNKTKFSRENIIYSNELVRDFKLLRRSNTLESIDIFINNRINELETLESFEEMNQLNWKSITQKAVKIDNAISTEAAEIYLYSLEAMPDIKGALQKAGDTAKKIFEKLFSIIAGFGKRVQSWINTFFMKQANDFYNKFPLAQFKNLDVEVTAVKLPNDIVSKLEKNSSDDAVNALRKQLSTMDFGDAAKMKETADQVNPNNIFKLIFGDAGEKGFPKKSKMKISEFFNGAKAGERPALLEVISPKMTGLWKKDVEDLKILGNAIRKAISTTQNKIGDSSQNPDAVKKYNESIAGLRFALARMQARKFNDFNAKSQIAMMVYNIAKKACSGKKEEKK